MGTSPEKPKKEPMSVRFLFIMAGVIWGLVLGPDIGLAVAKFMGGLNWPFIAGTREWPEWADWVIIASGVVTGLAIFFTALIIGRNVGDRLEYSHDVRLSSGGAIPWAIIAVGVAMGGITVLTIEDRQQAVVVYVQDQKSALVRLEAFANQVQRFRAVRVEWPGNGEEGRVSLSFRGKHQGRYMLNWEVWDSSNREEPVMEGSIGASLRPGDQNTSLPLSPLALVNAWQLRGGNGAKVKVDEDFTFHIRLIPEPTRAEWERLPRHEPGNLADGKSILIDEAKDSFPVYFELRGSQIIWSPQ
ncbi:MAG: hypothetical protein KAJ11_02100 [Alphaproteobacteria bacterium]|nr:hypothetical protein [Alphaproteobacteria bacterium]